MYDNLFVLRDSQTNHSKVITSQMPKCHFGNGDNDSDNNDNDEIDNIDVWRTPNNNIRLCLKLVYEFDSCIHISPIHTDTHTHLLTK